jgi:hypothetical protein
MDHTRTQAHHSRSNWPPLRVSLLIFSIHATSLNRKHSGADLVEVLPGKNTHYSKIAAADVPFSTAYDHGK